MSMMPRLHRPKAAMRAASLILFAATAATAIGAGTAMAQQADSGAPTKVIGTPHITRPVPSLAVINAGGAKLDGGKLTLTNVAPNTIVFADRPVRAAGHEMTTQFIMQWDKGKDSFENDPPNATVSILGAKPGEVADAVVVLKSPKLEGTTLTFDVEVLEGPASGLTGPAALFIDWFAARGAYGGGVAHFGGVGGATFARGGYWHAPVYHGAWYGHPAYGVAAGAAVGVAAGAALGAAAAYPYRPPVCGYYPYPPCY